MDLWTLLNTPLDELYDLGILPEPEPERDVKMNVLTYKCILCGDVYTERYARNNPDKLSRGMYCTECTTPSMFLEQATPYTIHYRSRSTEYASFVDDVSGECWKCGETSGLVPVTFSNGQVQKLCKAHFKPYVKEAHKALARKQEWTERSSQNED